MNRFSRPEIAFKRLFAERVPFAWSVAMLCAYLRFIPLTLALEYSPPFEVAIMFRIPRSTPTTCVPAQVAVGSTR